MIRRPAIAAALLLVSALPAAAQQIPEPIGAPISLQDARRIVAAGQAEARKQNFRMAFAIIEPNGQLVAFERMDGVEYGAIQVSQDKGRAAALFLRPTSALANQFTSGPGGVAILSMTGAVPIAGGVPIVMGGKMVGALGVSGGTPQQDSEIAAVTAAAIR